MIQKPMDVLRQHPVRKSRKQKSAFREDVMSYLRELGYDVKEEKGSFGSRNVVAGDTQSAEFLLTAHYDTCAHMPFPNLITPCNFWSFMGYQLFTVIVMFAFVFIFGLVTMLLTNNQDITFYVSYASLWLFLALLMFGPANRNNANDNTSGVVTLLEIAKNLPVQHRSEVCFVLFDLEEAGLLGSASYAKAHKQSIKNQLVLNLDCVGDGEEIVMFPGSKLKKQRDRMDALESICGSAGCKTVSLRKKGFSVYPSDQANFPLGVGIAALHHSPFGLYLGRIHTNRDTILDEDNVMILRDRLIHLITGSAEQ